MNGPEMYALAKRLYPLPRSLTGRYVRETLDILGEHIPLDRHAVTSGSKVYDWTVPQEWHVEGAYLSGPNGRVCSWEDNPLHLVFYSQSHQEEYMLDELREHIYTSAHGIPYVTSYYADSWGFCLSEEQADALPEGKYRVRIHTRHEPGQLDYADLVIPGSTREEVFFSTYICHPHMANDNTSSMVVQTALAEWVASRPRKYTYRFAFVPETIGALVYMWHGGRLELMQRRTVAGFALSCMGDDGPFSAVHSRGWDTEADRLSRAVGWSGKEYDWMARGSDERQYGSPLADLPVVGLSRSRWGTYPEYHTSADDMSLLSPESLNRSLDGLKDIVRIIEGNGRYRARFVGDAQLGDRGLYPTLGHGERDKRYQHVLSYCDGTLDAIDIAERTGLRVQETIDALNTLAEHELVEVP